MGSCFSYSEIKSGAEYFLGSREHVVRLLVIAKGKLRDKVVCQAHGSCQRVFAGNTFYRAVEAYVAVGLDGEIIVGREQHDLDPTAAHPREYVDADARITRKNVGNANISGLCVDYLFGVDEACGLDKCTLRLISPRRDTM